MPTKRAAPNRPSDPAAEARARGRYVADPPAESKDVCPRRKRLPRGPPVNGAYDTYTIAEFCLQHAISEAMYHKLQGLGLGPTVMRLGSRVLISRESAAAWRRQREAASAAQQADST